jgi:hypothetical protein
VINEHFTDLREDHPMGRIYRKASASAAAARLSQGS